MLHLFSLLPFLFLLCLVGLVGIVNRALAGKALSSLLSQCGLFLSSSGGICNPHLFCLLQIRRIAGTFILYIRTYGSSFPCFDLALLYLFSGYAIAISLHRLRRFRLPQGNIASGPGVESNDFAQILPHQSKLERRAGQRQAKALDRKRKCDCRVTRQ